jgi:hypothetical protein
MSSGQEKFCGNAHIFQAGPLKVSAEFTGLTLAGQEWNTGSLSLTLDSQLPKFASPVADRLADLLDTIGGK